jgi:hypothetical protein
MTSRHSLRRVGRAEAADEIVSVMKASGYDLREIDPFAGQPSLVPVPAAATPIAGRIRARWTSMRGTVLDLFPPATRRARGQPQMRPIKKETSEMVVIKSMR